MRSSIGEESKFDRCDFRGCWGAFYKHKLFISFSICRGCSCHTRVSSSVLQIYGNTFRFVGGKRLYAAITDAAVTATTWPFSRVLLNVYRHRCTNRRMDGQTAIQMLEIDRCHSKGKKQACYFGNCRKKSFFIWLLACLQSLVYDFIYCLYMLHGRQNLLTCFSSWKRNVNLTIWMIL